MAVDVTEETLHRNIFSVIGQGIDFPLQYTSDKSIRLSNAMERINDSIHIILSTRPGERLFNPEFGSQLYTLLFEPNDIILHRMLKFYTAEALRRWEKRIEITAVSLNTDLQGDGHAIGIMIQYRVRNSYIEGSYVYPFVQSGMPSAHLYTGVEVAQMQNEGEVR